MLLCEWCGYKGMSGAHAPCQNCGEWAAPSPRQTLLPNRTPALPVFTSVRGPKTEATICSA